MKIPLLFLILPSLIAGQNKIIWDKTFGGSGIEILRGGCQPTSFGYLFAGDSDSDITGNKTISSIGVWLIGTDKLGNKLWEKGICETSGTIWNFERTKDGNFVLCINSGQDTCKDKSKSSWLSDIWIVIIDENGNVLRENTIKGNGNDFYPRIATTKDGGFIACVSSHSEIGFDKTDTSRGSGDYWILKLDSFLNIQWQKTIGGTKQDDPKALCETTTGYVIAGTSYSAINGDKTVTNFGADDYWVIKMDSIGNIEWQKEYGGNLSDDAYSVIETLNGNILIAGTSLSQISGNKSVSNYGDRDIWTVLLDSKGNEIRQNTYGGSSSESPFVYLKKDNASKIYILGSSSSPISGNKSSPKKGLQDFWLLQISENGEINWELSLGGSSNEVLRNIYFENDSTFLLCGESNSNISGDKSENSFGLYDYWFLKIKMEDLTKSHQNQEKFKFEIYPNPTHQYLNIITNIKYTKVELTNLQTGISNNYFSFQNNKIDLSELKPGIYKVTILDDKDKGVYYQKIIKY